MIGSSCDDMRKLLAAAYDGELAVDRQIALEVHLEDCRGCARAAGQLVTIGSALRAAAADRRRKSPLRESVQARVVARIAAERFMGLSGRLERLAEDTHVLWAAVGATAATILCAMVAFAVLSYASPRRADSLAGILAVLASPGSNENPIRPDSPIIFPRVDPLARPGALLGTVMDAPDDLFVLAAVLTREGTLIGLEELRPTNRTRGDAPRLLDAAAGARFQPARLGQTAVAVSVVWLMAHTTVTAPHVI